MEIKQNIGRNCPKNYIYSSRHSMTIEKKMKGDIESENNGRDHDKKKVEAKMKTISDKWTPCSV